LIIDGFITDELISRGHRESREQSRQWVTTWTVITTRLIFNSCSVCVSKICYWSVMSLEHDARPARSAGGVSANRAGIRLVTLMFNTSTLAFKSIHAYYHVCTEKLIYWMANKFTWITSPISII